MFCMRVCMRRWYGGGGGGVAASHMEKNRKIYVQHENPFVRSEFCFATLISWFVVNVNDEVKMRLVSVSSYPIEIYMRNVV